MSKFIDKICVGILITFILWIGASYVEILCKNLDQNPEYSDYNIIVYFTEEAHEELYGEAK